MGLRVAGIRPLVATVCPAVLQRLARHANIATTMGYYVSLGLDEIGADLWANHSREVTTTQHGMQHFVQHQAVSGGFSTRAECKHSPNPFVVTRFIGSAQPNLGKDRMNAVTTNRHRRFGRMFTAEST